MFIRMCGRTVFLVLVLHMCGRTEFVDLESLCSFTCVAVLGSCLNQSSDSTEFVTHSNGNTEVQDSYSDWCMSGCVHMCGSTEFVTRSYV